MSRDLKILNPGVSINQGKILSDVSNIGGGAPIAIWKGNLMECTWTIQTTIMMNSMNKNRGRYKPIKGQVPLYKGLWKLNWKQWKCKMPHSVLVDALCIVHYLCNVPVINNKYDWTLQPVKIEGRDEAQLRKWLHMIYYFICFPPLILFLVARKAPGLAKYTFQHGSLPYQK